MKKIFLFIAIALVLSILLGGCTSNNNAANPNPPVNNATAPPANTPPANSPPATDPGAAASTPREVYAAYLSAVKAGNIATVKSFVSAESVQQLESMTNNGANPSQILAMIAAMEPASYEITDETITGDTAVLKATSANPGNGMPGPVYATITFVKEDGKWKLNKEQWGSQQE